MAPGATSDESREALLKARDSTTRPSLDESEATELDSLVSDGEEKHDDHSKGPAGRVSRAYSQPSPRPSAFRRLLPSRKCLLILLILTGGLVGVLFGGAFYAYKVRPPDGQSPPWYPTPRGGTEAAWAASYAKAADIVRKMTLAEKVNATTGVGWASDLCVGNTGPARAAGFPALCLQDGPLGLRFVDHVTAFPAGVTVAAAWNRRLTRRRAQAMAREARMKGVNVLLAPCVGPLGLKPLAGRNWEGFGSDPVLQAVHGAATVEGIQGEGVMATVKHLIGNEQEHFRQPWAWGLPQALSSNVDDRTLHELYLWPFADAVRAGVASVMCSYQMLNNSFACGNSKLLNGLLKDELGFQGFVVTDWLAQRSGVGSALAGLDMSMPGDGLFWADGVPLWGGELSTAVLNGSVPVRQLDEMVVRIVASWFQLGQDDEKAWPRPPPEGDGGPNFSSWTNDEYGLLHDSSGEGEKVKVNQFVDAQGIGEEFHGRLAKEIAQEGIVLVKNDGTLPLSKSGTSPSEDASDASKFKVGIFGEDAGPPPRGLNKCADQACNEGTLTMGWGSGTADLGYLVDPLQALEATFDHSSVDITSSLTNKAPSADILQSQDLCLVFANSDAGEGYASWKDIKGDRNDMHLQKGGDALIQAVARSCKGPVVVVVHAVGPVVVESWIDDPKIAAVLLAHLPGQESGNALTAVLFGNVDASGRLPYTVGKRLDDYGPDAKVMYVPNGVIPQQDFDAHGEGLLPDYRYFDKHGIAPRFEFGFGLSYTTFEYTDLKLTTLKPRSPLPDPRPPSAAEPPALDTAIPDASEALWPANFHQVPHRIYPYVSAAPTSTLPTPVPSASTIPASQLSPAGGAPGGNPSLFAPHLRVAVTVTNSGAERAGQEVVQLYVAFPANEVDPGRRHVDFPVRVLRGFEKVALAVGESKTVEMELTRRDLSYWCVWRQNWVMPAGEFRVGVGRSSRDVKLEGMW